jgi:hypothetical protein
MLKIFFDRINERIRKIFLPFIREISESILEANDIGTLKSLEKSDLTAMQSSRNT